MAKFDLFDAMQDLARLSAGLRHESHGKLRVHSKLAEVVARLSSTSYSGDSRTSIELARVAWFIYLETNNESELSQRFIRILSGVSDICLTDTFQHLIEKHQPLTSARVICNLLTVYHLNWSSQDQRNRIEETLKQAISGYSGKNKLLQHYQENIQFILGPDAAQALGKDMARQRHSVEATAAGLRVPLSNTSFGRASCSYAALECALNIANSVHFLEQDWDYLMTLLSKDAVLEGDRIRAVSLLITALDRKKTTPLWTGAHQQLKDYCLAVFHDPRVRSVKWNSFEKSVVATFIAWLSEEDLVFFFELIITYDPHRRKPFWMQYLHSIKRSRVIVSDSDVFAHQSKLRDLEKKGRSFARGSGNDSSAFVLDFGDFVAVEFSLSGNACYIYESHVFNTIVPNFFSSSIDLRGLKKRDVVYHRQPHPEPWVDQLPPVLAQIGIFKDDAHYKRNRN